MTDPRSAEAASRPPWTHALRAAALVLGTGYALFFFSETVFWSVWRPRDTAHGRALGWLLYSLLGYLTLAVIRYGRVRSGGALLLAGALFGWVDEGVFAMTLFGDPSMPFPFTIAWTALAWHGPLSFCVGWYALGRALRGATPASTLALSLALGALWGLWGSGWRADAASVRVEPAAFVLHATVTTAGLALAHVAIDVGQPARFRPTRAGLIVAGSAVLGFFVAVTVPRVAIAPLVLIPLLTVASVAIVRDGRGREDSALDALAAPVRARNLVALAALPASASVVYAIATRAFGSSGAVHLLMAVASSVVGAAMVVAALIRAGRRR